jgi:hypothetical protein
MFAYLCTLNKSCSKFYKEQTLFNDLELDQCLTWSKSAHKVKIGAVLGLRIFLSLRLHSSFGVPLFDAL